MCVDPVLEPFIVILGAVVVSAAPAASAATARCEPATCPLLRINATHYRSNYRRRKRSLNHCAYCAINKTLRSRSSSRRRRVRALPLPRGGGRRVSLLLLERDAEHDERAALGEHRVLSAVGGCCCKGAKGGDISANNEQAQAEPQPPLSTASAPPPLVSHVVLAVEVLHARGAAARVRAGALGHERGRAAQQLREERRRLAAAAVVVEGPEGSRGERHEL